MYNTEVSFDDLADLRQEAKEIIPLIASVIEGHDKIQRVTDLMTSIENLRDKAVKLFSTDDTNVGTEMPPNRKLSDEQIQTSQGQTQPTVNDHDGGKNPLDHIPTVKRPKSSVRREVPQERIDEDGWDSTF